MGGASINGLPESVYSLYQMTFAIITPALIVGADDQREGLDLSTHGESA